MVQLKMNNSNLRNLMLIFIVFIVSAGFVFSQNSLLNTYISDLKNSCRVKKINGFYFFAQDQSDSANESIAKSDKTLKKTVNLSGIWESSIGWRYNMKQKGKDFTWSVINRNQTATGKIGKNNKEINVTWNDNGSKGTVKGLILEVDKKGKATFIEWDNGVFFHRK